MITETARMRRLFYALWPDNDTSERLKELQGGLRGHKTHGDDFHITLVFLGMQEPSLLPVLFEVLNGLLKPDMLLSVDKYGCFKRQRIVWAGMTTPPPALFQMQSELVGALLDRQIVFNRESQFTPHITLARKAQESPLCSFEPITCRFDRIALVESVGGTGAKYRVLLSR